MRHIILLFSILFVSIFTFYSCDKIEGNPVDGAAALNAVFDANGRELRKIFLEDYTGQGCGNCPLAAIESARLVEIFGKRIVPVSVHAGFFANPARFPYATLSTPLGEIYDTEFGNSSQGNPNGLISRIDNDNSKVFTPSDWSTGIGTMLTDLAPFTINIETAFISDSSFTTSISGEFILNSTDSYKIILSVLEDSIVAPQHFYANIDGRPEESVEDDYLHRHTLRDNINGTWGTPFSGGTIKQEYEISFPEYKISKDWVKKQLIIAAYVYNTDTKEILHVTEVHLIH
jgi:hypothetical protein